MPKSILDRTFLPLKDQLWYLASPYSTNAGAALKHRRFQDICRISADLISHGYHIFSPIAQCHGIAIYGSLQCNFEAWLEYDKLMISKCTGVMVVNMVGFMESKGVNAEIAIALDQNKPVLLLDISTLPKTITLSPIKVKSM